MNERGGVVHVITTIERGGAENALLSLVSEQSKVLPVVVVPLKGKPELYSELVSNGVRVDLSILNKSFLKQVICFRRKYRTEKAFHAHLPRAEILLLMTKKSVRYFVTRHNAERFFPRSPRLFSSKLSRSTLENSYEVVAISNAVKTFLLSQRELPPDTNCSVIYYGYERKNLDSIADHRNKSLPTNRILNIISISRLSSQKNITLQIEFVEKLNAFGVPAKLDIVGDGPQRAQIQKRISRPQPVPVNLLGRKSDVVKILCGYDLFLLTSNYEGFGLVLLEAMDAGLPILAPKNSAIPEVLGVNHPGLFHSQNLDDLIAIFFKLRQDPKMIADMLEQQEQRLKKFSIRSYSDKHLKLYKSHLSAKR